MIGDFDAIEYVAVLLLCGIWGFVMGRAFGYNFYAIAVMALVGVLIIYVWGT